MILNRSVCIILFVVSLANGLVFLWIARPDGGVASLIGMLFFATRWLQLRRTEKRSDRKPAQQGDAIAARFAEWIMEQRAAITLATHEGDWNHDG